LRVEVLDNVGRSEYFAVSVEAICGSRKGTVRLISENELGKGIPRREINSIMLTPAQEVNY
jgi:hypothetical protein